MDTPDTPPTPDPPADRQPEASGGKGRTGRSGARGVVAAAIASGVRHKDAAARAGVSPRVVRLWMREPGFVARVAELRRRLVDACLGKLSDAMADSAKVLRRLLKDTDPDVRHRAAVQVITLASKLRAETDHEERLTRIEALLGGGKADGDHGPTGAGGAAGPGPGGAGR